MLPVPLLPVLVAAAAIRACARDGLRAHRAQDAARRGEVAAYARLAGYRERVDDRQVDGEVLPADAVPGHAPTVWVRWALGARCALCARHDGDRPDVLVRGVRERGVGVAADVAGRADVHVAVRVLRTRGEAQPILSVRTRQQYVLAGEQGPGTEDRRPVLPAWRATLKRGAVNVGSEHRRHVQPALELCSLVAKIAVTRPVPTNLLKRNQIRVLRADDIRDVT